MPKIGDYVARVRLDASQAKKGLEKFDSEVKKTGDRAENRFSKLGSGISAKLAGALTGAAVVSAGVGIVKVAADIEQSFNSVRKTTGLTKQEITSLKGGLFDLTRELPVTITGLGDIATVAGQLGIQGTDNIKKFTETFAKLEIASDRTISGELGAQQFAKFLDLTGAGVDKASNLASAFTELGNTSKFTEGQLLSTALQVSKGSKAFGLSAEDTLGLAATFTELAIQPEVARTSVTRFFSAVDTAKNTGKGLKELAKITGLTADEVRRLDDTDPAKLLGEFSKGLGKANRDGVDLTKQMKKLGLGGTTANITFKALSTNTDRFIEQLKKSNEASKENTALNVEAKASSETFNAQLQLLKNSFVELGDSIANSGILEGVTNIVSGIAGAINTITDKFSSAKKDFEEVDLSTFESKKQFAKNQINTARRSFDTFEVEGQVRDAIAFGGLSLKEADRLRSQLLAKSSAANAINNNQTTSNNTNQSNTTINIDAPITTAANAEQVANSVSILANQALTVSP